MNLDQLLSVSSGDQSRDEPDVLLVDVFYWTPGKASLLYENG